MKNWNECVVCVHVCRGGITMRKWLIYTSGALSFLSCYWLVPRLRRAQMSSSRRCHVFRVRATDCKFEPVKRVQTGFRLHDEPGIVTALHGVADCKSIRRNREIATGTWCLRVWLWQSRYLARHGCAVVGQAGVAAARGVGSGVAAICGRFAAGNGGCRLPDGHQGYAAYACGHQPRIARAEKDLSLSRTS